MRTSILLGLLATALVAGAAHASTPPAPAVHVFTRPAGAVARVPARTSHVAPPARLSPTALAAALAAVRVQLPPANNPPTPPNPSPPPPLRSFTTWTTPQSGDSLVFVGASEISENGAQDYAAFTSAGGLLTAGMGGLQQNSYYMLDCRAEVEVGAANWSTNGNITVSVSQGAPQVVPISGGHLLFAFQGAPDLAVQFWVDPGSPAESGETGWTYYGCDLHAVS